MGFGDYAERDTKLTPYTREKINPRNWKDYEDTDEDLELGDQEEGADQATPDGSK